MLFFLLVAVAQLVPVHAALSALQNAEYAYSPFGKQLKATGPRAHHCPFRFAGQYYDSETGTNYFGYRHYDPRTKQWLNRDPIGEEGGLNLFAYADNDPINGIDVLGLATINELEQMIDIEMALHRKLKAGWSARRRARVGGTMHSRRAASYRKRINAMKRQELMFNTWLFASANIANGGVINDRDQIVANAYRMDDESPAHFVYEMIDGATTDIGIELGTLGFAKILDIANDVNRLKKAKNLRLSIYDDVPLDIRMSTESNVINLGAVDGGVVYNVTEDFEDIVSSGRVWGQTEGSVYGMVQADAPRWRTMADVPVNSPGTIIFEGDAAKLFQPHPVEGPYSGLKRLLGQQKAGFGDIALDSFTRSGNTLHVTSAHLVPHAGQSTRWASARLWGRRLGIEPVATTALGLGIYYSYEAIWGGEE